MITAYRLITRKNVREKKRTLLMLSRCLRIAKKPHQLHYGHYLDTEEVCPGIETQRARWTRRGATLDATSRRDAPARLPQVQEEEFK